MCVTGASGFIAGQVIKLLLTEGHQVCGTVRGAVDDQKYAYLLQLPRAGENLRLFVADLTRPGSFDAAIADCDYVIHMASPFLMETKSPQQELIDPAVKGTLNVLAACQKTDTVKRVVLTSSLAAISDGPDDNYVFSENDWNQKSSLKRNTYFYSKVLAERAAWDFVREHNTRFDLVALNPGMVLGESLGPAINGSNQVIRDLLSGVYPGIMALNFCMVDVCDVARAHMQALETPAARGRYLCSSDSMTMAEIVALLKTSGYSAYKLPKRDMSAGWISGLVKLLSYTQPKGAGDFIRSHLGKTMRVSNERASRQLGIEFRPVRETLLATIKDLQHWGHI